MTQPLGDTRVAEDGVVTFRLPAGADLSTLRIWGADRVLEADSWAVTRASGGLSGDVEVSCQLSSPFRAGPMVIGYTLTGLSWKAAYEMHVRKDELEFSGPASAQVSVFAIITNALSSSFWVDRLKLVHQGNRSPARRPVSSLLMGTGGITPRWRESANVANDAESAFEVNRELVIPMGFVLHVTLTQMSKVPAYVRYALSAGESDGLGKKHFLIRQLVLDLREIADSKLLPLPPGDVQLYWGARRQMLWQAKAEGRFEQLVINMGPTDRVWARKQRLRSDTVDATTRLEVYEWLIQNSAGTNMSIRIEDTITRIGTWSVVSSSIPFEQQMNRLSFACTVPAGEFVISYRLRVRELGIGQ